MNALDTLQVVIEADTHALEATLKGAIGKVQNMIDVLNSDQINWKKIMTQSLSPALISGVAAMFALALTQSMKFSQNLATAGATGSEVFGNSLEYSSGNLTKFADSIHQTSGDVAKAMAIASNTFSDAAVQSEIVAAAGMLAAMGFGEFNSITAELTDTMKAWGLTTAPQVHDAIDSIWEASKNGSIGFNQLVDTIKGAGVALSGITTIKDTAMTIEAMTKAMPKADVISIFASIKDGAQNTTDGLNLLLGKAGAIRETIEKQGLSAVFQAIAVQINKYPYTAAQLLGQQFGLTGDAVDAFRATSVENLKKVTAEMEVAITKTKDLEKAFKVFNVMNPFAGLWTHIENFFTDMGTRITSFFSELKGSQSFGDIMDALGGKEGYVSTPMLSSNIKSIGSPANTTSNQSNGQQTTNRNMNTGNITINQYISSSANAKDIGSSTSSALQKGLMGMQIQI
jgi:hypothetical protein